MELRHIIIVLDSDKNSSNKVQIAIKIAEFLQLEIALKWIIKGPTDWEDLNRTQRDKYPTVKTEVQHARNVMDSLLKTIRDKKINASKEFHFTSNGKVNVSFHDSDLLLIDTTQLKQAKLFEKCTHYLIIPTGDSDLNFDTVVYTSDYTNSNNCPEHLLTAFTLKGNIRLELVYINTPTAFENSTISIQKIKNIISNLALARTNISIFQSDSKVEGLMSFAHLKNGDLAVINQAIDFETVKTQDLSLPLLLLNQHE